MPTLDPINIGSIIVGFAGVLGGWLTQRSAAKANRFTAETEAYNRARKLDIETIERQDKEYEELQAKLKQMKAERDEKNLENEKLLITKRALLNQVESLNDQLRGHRRSG